MRSKSVVQSNLWVLLRQVPSKEVSLVLIIVHRSSFGLSLRKISLKNAEIETAEASEDSILNKHLDVALSRRTEDIEANEVDVSYSIFEWEDNSTCATWNLVSNSCYQELKSIGETGLLFQAFEPKIISNHLIPEYKDTPFFLKIVDDMEIIDLQTILTTLNNIPAIITSYAVDSLKLKHKDHLIF